MTDDRCLSKVDDVADLLNRLQAKSVFLVIDEIAYDHSGAKREIEPILRNYEVTSFSNFEPNPKFEDVLSGMKLFQEARPDVVLCIGGGTAIDISKLIVTLSNSPVDPHTLVTKSSLLTEPRCPLIVVPTTSGTGSEATQFAVVYLDGVKHSVDHPALMPAYCVLDAALTANLPAPITAQTGLDAFSQAIESMWSVRSNDQSFSNAQEAAELAFLHLERAVRSQDHESRLAMCRAAHLAGRAINQTRTTAPHAISYAFTSDYGVPHGQAVALTLGPMLVHNAGVTENDVNDPRGVAFVQQRIKRILSVLNCETPQQGCQVIQDFVQRVGCQIRLSPFGVHGGDEELLGISRKVNLERLSNNPRKLTTEQLVELLRSIT